MCKSKNQSNNKRIISKEDEDVESEAEQVTSTSRIPAPAFGSARNQVALRTTAKEMRERMLVPQQEQPVGEDIDQKRGHRRSVTEFNEPTGQGRPRVIPDPVEISTSTEQDGEVPTDIDTGEIIVANIRTSAESNCAIVRERYRVSGDEDTNSNSETCTATTSGGTPNPSTLSSTYSSD